MHKKQQKHALQRGVHAARLWKKLKKVISAWDSRCVVIAKNRRFPVWAGHIPVATVVLISFIGIAVGSFVIGIIILVVWALLLISDLFKSPAQVEVTNWDDRTKANYERFSWENDRFQDTHNKHSWHQND